MFVRGWENFITLLALPSPVWVLLSYVLQAFILGSVYTVRVPHYYLASECPTGNRKKKKLSSQSTPGEVINSAVT